MFDDDVQIRGKHATYWKALSNLPGNAVDREAKKHFKIFENYIHVYMVAPIIGLLYNRKGQYDPKDKDDDTAGMLAAVLIKNAAKLKYIYRLIILSDDSLGLSPEEKIDLAFRDTDKESEAKGMKLYHDYFLGGLEVLYEEFVLKCDTDDDYLVRLYEFISDFNNEHSIEDLTPDIEGLLSK